MYSFLWWPRPQAVTACPRGKDNPGLGSSPPHVTKPCWRVFVNTKLALPAREAALSKTWTLESPTPTSSLAPSELTRLIPHTREGPDRPHAPAFFRSLAARSPFLLHSRLLLHPGPPSSYNYHLSTLPKLFSRTSPSFSPELVSSFPRRAPCRCHALIFLQTGPISWVL